MSAPALPTQQKKTGWALLWSNLLSEPLFTLYTFLVFVMYKDLGASTFQVALLASLKPIITILSFYWSAGLKGRARKLKSNVLWAGFLMRAPFLLCFWIDSVWFLIFAAVNYMFFYRAGLPAWLEILKRNMGESARNHTFSISSALGYAEGIVIALACGAMLDRNPGCWQALFCTAAAIGLVTLFVQSRIVVIEQDEIEKTPTTMKELLIRPWRDSFRLMKERLDFSRFQWGFMVSGFGLMLIQPAIPIFAVDVLGVSHLEMLTAVSIAKGLGFSLSSPIWAKWMGRLHLFKLASLVFVTIGLMPVLLSFSVWSAAWLYIAYFCYGIGQGGSHLVWNMSGPIFAGKEDSARYTGVNVAMAGVRGAVAPPLGGFLAVAIGPIQVLFIGGALCFYSGIRMLQSKFVKDPLTIKR
ncbi:MAG: MFS transporter [Verrucomicrobia bacterium]|nr:MFS transporter [Verrucomicrobiota bacterium]MBU6446017.1 MFS transporter [Verrucomicrobiota bacterium]MDE3047110.1 MFS transporter [Verrucomicrobiota bacterium]